MEPNELSNEEFEDFNQTNKCSSCEQSLKVRDHLTGLYRGPACNSCYLKLKYKPHIYIISHNFTGYDSHFIIPELTRFIKQNQYMKDDEPKEYTPKILASNFAKYRKIEVGPIKFLDSLSFMNASIANLAKALNGKYKYTKVVRHDDGKDILPYSFLSSAEKFDTPIVDIKHEDLYNILKNIYNAR